MSNERINTNVIRWFTIIEYVDIETGEIITESEYKRNKYYTIKNEKGTTEFRGNFGYRKINKICRRTGQTELF